MTRGSTKQVAILLLGILLAVGMGLSAVHASTMIGGMPMSSGMDMGETGPLDCDACGGAGDKGMQAADCGVACVGQAFALPLFGSINPALHSQLLLLLPAMALPGRMAAPEPHPPKTIHLA